MPPDVTGEGATTAGADRRALLAGVARHGGLAMAGTSAAAVLGFLLTLTVTRGLSTTAAGQFFSATAVFFVLQTFLSFGVGAGLVRFVPRLIALGRTADVPALLVVAVVPVVVLGAAGSAALDALAPTLAARIARGADVAGTTTALRLLALFLLVGVLETVAVEGTRAFGSIAGYVLNQQIALPLARPVLVALAVAVHAPLWGVVLAWLVPLVVVGVLATRVVLRALRREFGTTLPWPPRTLPLPAIAREYWAFTGARGLAGVIDILLTWLDVLLVAALVSSATAAVYAAASRFVTTGTLVLSAMRLAIAPQLSSALAREDRQGASAMYLAASQWVVLASWPLYLLMAAFAPTVLRLFGEGYVRGAPALSILCLAMMVNLAAGNVGTVLLMGGKSLWVLADKVGVLTVNVVADLVLIPPYGISGAAVGWAVTIVVDSLLAFSQVRWGMRVGGDSRGLRAAAVLALLCFGASGLAVRLVLGSSPLALLGCTVVATTAYALLLHRRRETLDLGPLLAGVRPRPVPQVVG